MDPGFLLERKREIELEIVSHSKQVEMRCWHGVYPAFIQYEFIECCITKDVDDPCELLL